MSDIESALTAMLQEEAATATLTADLVDAARRLGSGLDEIDRARRSRDHRTTITLAAAFVAATVVVALTMLASSAHPTTPEPVRPPTLVIQGGEVVKRLGCDGVADGGLGGACPVPRRQPRAC